MSAAALATASGSSSVLPLSPEAGPLAGQAVPDLYRDLATMVGFGPRLTGSNAHQQFIDWLEDGLTQVGLRVQRTTQSFTRWTAQSTGLVLNGGPAAGRVQVAAPYPYCGPTPAAGVTGNLAYVGGGSSAEIAAADLRGAIAVLDIGPFTRVPLSYLDPLKVSSYDPDGTLRPDELISFAFNPDTPLPMLDALKQAGAIGALMMIDSCPGYVANQ
ncbi:hypothetical protein BX265_6917 [Streptomyces sp. TLI_235]|nr:hypothetical protein [Streptomyces sp. TLI_235]PBC69586.1 hypothetical protein BX265_6917 [Streptomyces sp. TLI_235]